MNDHREMTPEFVAWLETMQPRTTAEARAAWYGWKAATSESRVWLVVDDKDNPEFCAGWPEACHEHINEALGMDIEEAKTWHVREAVLMPLPPNNQGNRSDPEG